MIVNLQNVRLTIIGCSYYVHFCYIRYYIYSRLFRIYWRTIASSLFARCKHQVHGWNKNKSKQQNMNVLRVSCTKAAGLVKTVVQKPAFRGLATVAENTIKITFVDQEVHC